MQQRRSSLRMPVDVRPPARLPPAWQQEEVAILQSLEEQLRAELVHAKRAQAYLEERKIPPELVLATGVGYLPPTMLDTSIYAEKKRILQRWAERLIFPLASPHGKGYIGRSLGRWQPGMDEKVHTTILVQEHSTQNWYNTNPTRLIVTDPERLSKTQ